MDPRFSLRFESGDRAGEVVPIEGQGFTIGRRPGHALQILDNSVSGRHAEIIVDEHGALLRDLGSTNGTRLGGERVIEARLVNGARIHFGNVELVFLDAAAGGFQAGPAGSAAASNAAGPSAASFHKSCFSSSDACEKVSRTPGRSAKDCIMPTD